ncbi:hypothetical protein GCM10010335_10240 [Streptomyces galbus]|nr:hypothetical protein GCM10010335_10240 [Streptomyces galbus]
MPSAALWVLLIQRTPSELARTPFRIDATALSSFLRAQFPVKLHEAILSVDNSRAVNRRSGAPS